MDTHQLEKIKQRIEDRFNKTMPLPVSIAEEFWKAFRHREFQDIDKAISRFLVTTRGKELAQFNNIPQVDDIIQHIPKPIAGRPKTINQLDREAKMQINDIHAWIFFNVSKLSFEKFGRQATRDTTPRQAVDKIIELMSKVHETIRVQLDKSEIVFHVHEAWRGVVETNSSQEQITFAAKVYKTISDELMESA